MLSDFQLLEFDSTHHQVLSPNGVTAIDKVSRYGWCDLDDPGKLMYLDKKELLVDRSYQRDELRFKTMEIAGQFSWKAFGAISVMQRDDGKYVVVDGQHRAIAAWKRSDIQKVPCIVFASKGMADEATCFINANTKRKGVTAFSKFRAKLVAGDEFALLLSSILADNGLSPSQDSKGVGKVACIAACERMLRLSLPSFKKSISVAADLSRSDQTCVSDILLGGLFYLDRHVLGGIQSDKIAPRLQQIGALALTESARKMAYRIGSGGQRVWAEGMLETINRSLRGKITLKP
jgi:predicted NodU family carbamoyl transferase